MLVNQEYVNLYAVCCSRMAIDRRASFQCDRQQRISIAVKRRAHRELNLAGGIGRELKRSNRCAPHCRRQIFSPPYFLSVSTMAQQQRLCLACVTSDASSGALNRFCRGRVYFEVIPRPFRIASLSIISGATLHSNANPSKFPSVPRNGDRHLAYLPPSRVRPTAPEVKHAGPAGAATGARTATSVPIGTGKEERKACAADMT